MVTKKDSHLKDLILLFAIPIAIAVFAAVVVYVPQLLAKPKSDFIYSYCDTYTCKDSYTVDASGTVVQDISNSPNYTTSYDHPMSLRYYDAASDSTRSLTYEESKQYRLNTSSKSPDGYTLTKESTSSGGFLFGGDYNEGWYLKAGAKKKKVELSTNVGAYSSTDITFLGWVNK